MWSIPQRPFLLETSHGNEKNKNNCVLLGTSAFIGLTHADLWINELHYDDSAGDENEAIEVVLTDPDVGIDLSTVTVSFYSGSGNVYDSATLDTFTVGDTGAGFAVYSFLNSGIQNGAPDGVSLDINGTLVTGQLLSYEGTFTAVAGPANGILSTDIGVSENGTTLPTDSLQLTGSGSDYANPRLANTHYRDLGITKRRTSYS